jgi:hypothetical protein
MAKPFPPPPCVYTNYNIAGTRVEQAHAALRGVVMSGAGDLRSFTSRSTTLRRRQCGQIDPSASALLAPR